MNSARTRQYGKTLKKWQKMSVSKHEPNKESRKYDAYLAVWILTKLGWSHRRIARLKLAKSKTTITAYYAEACDLIESGKLAILPKSERAIKMFSAGKSDDVAYLYGKVHQNPCGGGKRITPHHYNDDWRRSDYEEE